MRSPDGIKDNHDMIESYAGLCEGFNCSKQSSMIVKVSLNGTSNIPFYLCEHCANKFKDSNHSNKTVLEQQFVEPACSNTSSQNQTYCCRGRKL